jgi:FixJ family two-component response regulator
MTKVPVISIVDDDESVRDDLKVVHDVAIAITRLTEVMLNCL